MVIKINYAAQHETIDPSTLLDYAEFAEKSGFDGIVNSDHFHPWAHNNAQCGFSWVWMASALERVPRIPIGTGVTSPIFRYNPAIIAQAFSTLGCMYPGRVFLGLGAGEACNEVPCGYEWPASALERVEKLEEAIIVIKKLWEGTLVTHKGKYFNLNKANLYTKSSTPIPIHVGSFGVKSAKTAGKYADGYITFSKDRFKSVLWPAVEEGAKEMGRDPSKIEKITGFCSSYDEDYDKALNEALIWRAAFPMPHFLYNIYDPREMEENGKLVGKEQFTQGYLIATNAEDYIKWFEDNINMGFNNIFIGSQSPNNEQFFKIMKEKVLPYIRETYRNK